MTVARLTAFLTALWAFLAALQGAHVLTGATAAWVAAAVSVLTAVLGWLTHRSVKAAHERALRAARGGR